MRDVCTRDYSLAERVVVDEGRGREHGTDLNQIVDSECVPMPQLHLSTTTNVDSRVR